MRKGAHRQSISARACCWPFERNGSTDRLGGPTMVKIFAAMGLGALVALSPLAAMAQSDGTTEPMQVAQATTSSAHAGGGGSHSRHLRHSRNTHKERARAGAEHMRQMRTAPAAPKS